MIAFELDEQIDAYESALLAGVISPEQIDRYLPADGENHGQLLVELLRITLEHRWQPGQADALSPWLARFPQLSAAADLLEPLAYEEYRLRIADGQSVERTEYARRYGIDVSSWRELTPPIDRGAPYEDESADSWNEFSQTAPAAAARIAVGRRRLPAVGESFGPFRLAALLGQGAFGKVFLAEQTNLANRLVALKVTAGPTVEADRLARMQHSHIVPIYSVHRRSRLSGVCMPYLGSVTLADLIAQLKTAARLPQSARWLADTVAARQAELSTVVGQPAEHAAESRESRPPPAAAQALAQLAARPLEEAMCQIMAGVAAGLAHAHRRGIIHRDLKPANILISDDGQPLVFDFNLATERTAATGHLARLGGTLPYMSPEQFELFQRGDADIQPSSDIFSLGVVLYESLTRQQPFPVRHGKLDEVVVWMLRDRRQLTPTPIRRLNPAVSPGLASIVEKCLDPRPDRRYHDAAELHEDLERHLQRRPLRFARERSWVEVASKWRRRHPRLSSATSVTLIALLLAAIAGGLWAARENAHAARAAEAEFAKFHAAVPVARTLLIASLPASPEEREGIAAAKGVLNRYHVLDDSRWNARRSVQRLAAASKKDLAADVADLQDLLARRELTAAARPSAATETWPPGAQEAIEDRRQATDLLLRAHALQQQGQPDFARPLEALTRSQPADAASWLVLGDCLRLARDFAGADAACTAAIALRADLYLTWYYRGIVRLQSGRADKAEADFQEALSRRPDFPGGWANRGLARQQQGQHSAAIEDLGQAIDRGLEDPAIYFARARSYKALGDLEAAQRDDQQAMRFQVHDAQRWYERGMAHLRLEDYPAAERDFEQALQLAPRFIGALRNLAHVQSEKLAHLDAAISTLNRILALQADDRSARISRGVLYARQGRRDEALADAENVVSRQPAPLEMCQAASLYALLAENDAELRSKALRCLEQSLARQPSLAALVAEDPDMANLRHDEQLIRLLAAAGGPPHPAAAAISGQSGK